MHRFRNWVVVLVLACMQASWFPAIGLAAETTRPSPSPAEERPPWADAPALRTMSPSGSYVGHSGLDPYKAFSQLPADETFIADQGGTLDQYLCRSASPITFNLEIDRVFGPIAKLSGQETYNNLQSPAAMVEAGVIAPNATLYMRVYDVDHDYQGSDFAPEADQVSINGHKLTRTLTSGNNKWDTVSYQVPIEWLFYPDQAAIGGSPAKAPNEIRVDIDVNNSGDDVWCVEVDWAVLHIQAMRPVVLVNGILSNDEKAWENFRPFLWERGVPHYAQEVDALFGGIYGNANLLAERIPLIKQAFGVEKVNVIAHSKGGLDSRAYLREHDDIDTLVQLATPNRGSDCAQSILANIFPFPSTYDLDPDWVYRNFNYKDTREHFWQPHKYVPAWTEQEKAPIYIFAGTRLTSTACPAGIGDPMDPPHDSVVSHDRATLPWNWSGTDGDGVDQGQTDRVGPYDHSSIHDSEEVAVQAMAWLAAKNGLGGSGGAFRTSAMQATSAPRPVTSMGTPATAPAQTPGTVRMVEQTGGPLAAGQTVAHQFPLESTAQAQVVLIRVAKETTSRLLGPDGSALSPSETGVAFGAYLADIYNLSQPQAGIYTAEVTAAADDHYELQVRTLGGPTLQASLDPDTIAPGAETTLTARLEAEDGAPLPGASLSAVLFARDGNRQSISFAEQGAGIYTAKVTGSFPGVNEIVVRAQKDGFQRTTVARLTVIPASAQLAGSVAESQTDPDGDGLHDSLVLGVDVTVAEEGRYQINGDLYDSTGQWIQQATASITASPGAVTVPLSFSGEALYAKGFSGPYVLKNVVLSDLTRDGLPVDARESLYTTKAYNASQFQHQQLMLVGGRDEATDTDGDGRYNWLDVTLNLKTEVAGTYRASARLVTETGEELDWGSGSAYLTPGTGQVRLRFNGSQIRAGGASGPYRVIDLMVEGPRVTVEPLAHVTQPYDVRSFQQIPTDLTVKPQRITVTPAKPGPNQTVDLSAVVENRGAAAQGSFLVEFYLGNPAQGGSLIGSSTIDEMPAESEQSVSLPWLTPAQRGTYEIYVVLNRARSVTEFDYSNNTAFQLITVDQSDTTPPTTTATETPAPNGSGWHNTPFTLTLSATDGESGVASTEYQIDEQGWQSYGGPIAFDQDGIYEVAYRSVDVAGNQESTQHLTVRLDQAPPTVTIDGVEPGQVSLLSPITPTARVTDGLDPNPSLRATLDGVSYTLGTPVSDYGTYLLVVTATDAAGNQTEERLTFTVADRPMYAAYLRERVDALAAAVEQGYTGPNVNSLLAKLRAVSARIAKAEDDLRGGKRSAAGHLTAADNQLEAFRRELRTVDVDESLRQQWVDEAAAIRQAIADLQQTL